MSKRKSRTPARNHAHRCRRRTRRVRPSIGELSDREFAAERQAAPDGPRMTLDARKMALTRLFANIKETWRTCPARLCRRRHRCSWNDPTRRMDCAGPPLSKEALDAARIDFCKTLAWVAAQRGL